ncbi:MAG: hypothetical protein ACI33P_07085 [Lysinibacillus sp.]
MRKWRKVLLGFAGVLAVVALLVFEKGPELQEEEMTGFITELYTVGFEESEGLFAALEKEIEEALAGANQEIVTFNSKTIEEAVDNKFGNYLTPENLETLLNEGVLTSLYQVAYDSRSDFKAAAIKKLDEEKKDGRIEVSYAVDIEQTHISSNALNAWSTEVKITAVEGDGAWEISRVEVDEGDTLGH